VLLPTPSDSLPTRTLFLGRPPANYAPPAPSPPAAPATTTPPPPEALQLAVLVAMPSAIRRVHAPDKLDDDLALTERIGGGLALGVARVPIPREVASAKDV
jgi:hypothetical protein